MSYMHSALDGRYQLRETIGSGGFAKVKLAYHVQSGEKVAIKIMNKVQLGSDLPRVQNEIEALKKLHHINICSLIQVIETEERYYLVLEYCPGGELFDYIVSRDRLPETEARHFFRQIVSAVGYLHESGYAHRDLKPENLLIDEDQNIKLIDFGLCANPMGGIAAVLETCCGSPAYAAPELVSGRRYLGHEVDVWSMGVLLYALLCGFLPFEDPSLANLYRKIQRGQYHKPEWLSAGSLSLLGGLMRVEPSARLTLAELRCHSWVTANGRLEEVASPVPCHLAGLATLDSDCLTELSVQCGCSRATLRHLLSEWRYDELTACYLLLRSRKCKGLPVRLLRPPLFTLSPMTVLRSPVTTGTPAHVLLERQQLQRIHCTTPTSNKEKTVKKHSSLRRPAIKHQLQQSERASPNPLPRIRLHQSPARVGQPVNVHATPPASPATHTHTRTLNFELPDASFVRFDDPSGLLVEPSMSPARSLFSPERRDKENRYNSPVYFAVPHTPRPRSRAVVHQNQSQPRSPSCPGDVDARRNGHNSQYQRPASVALPGDSGNGSATPRSYPCTSPLSPSRSIDSCLPSSSPNTATTPHRSDGTSGGSRSLFGSLERGLDRVRAALVTGMTPRKRSTADGPRRVRALHNVTVSSHPTEPASSRALDKLRHALRERSILFKAKGDYLLRCSVCDDWGKAHLVFDLEVCALTSGGVGVRRKRVKGDTWYYKRLCEDVILAAQI